MSRKGEEVHIQVLHINLHVRNRLSPVHHQKRSLLMNQLGNLLDGIDDTEDIRSMSQRDKLGPLIELGTEIFHIQSTILEIDIDQLGSSLSTSFLPENDIGMVLHNRNQHFITRLQPFSHKPSHPIETRRGSSCKEDFSARSRIDKRTNSFSGCFISCRRPLG